MFTGLIEELGTVEELRVLGDAARLRVRGARVSSDTQPGDSIAVNGCCLTVVERDDETFTADVMLETLDRTALGSLEPGGRVNLERAVTPATRLGGHIVQGHVDGTGSVVRRSPSEHWEVVEISVPTELERYLVPKGSVSVDGVSLTIVEVLPGGPTFTVSLIPETIARTTLGFKQPGEPVNVEVDVIAKYVERLVTR
ncbi:MAG: riboflavin synthase [Actinomycetota bacterium]|nr:riboflavin synthase [Actinomycetota bacterium]